ncbi:MAG: hypothetical protein ACRC5T_02415 [Cetobacterium sp.]
MKKYLSIYFDLELIESIKKLSIKEGRSFNNMVITLLKESLKGEKNNGKI